jgi:hypothetical protein
MACVAYHRDWVEVRHIGCLQSQQSDQPITWLQTLSIYRFKLPKSALGDGAGVLGCSAHCIYRQEAT